MAFKEFEIDEIKRELSREIEKTVILQLTELLPKSIAHVLEPRFRGIDNKLKLNTEDLKLVRIQTESLTKEQCRRFDNLDLKINVLEHAIKKMNRKK